MKNVLAMRQLNVKRSSVSFWATTLRMLLGGGAPAGRRRARRAERDLRLLGLIAGLLALLASAPFNALRPERAFADGSGYTIADLGVLPGLPGSTLAGSSSATAINNAGVVVGHSTAAVANCAEFNNAAGPSAHAFRWTPETGMQDLGALGPDGLPLRGVGDGCRSFASAINDTASSDSAGKSG